MDAAQQKAILAAKLVAGLQTLLQNLILWINSSTGQAAIAALLAFASNLLAPAA